MSKIRLNEAQLMRIVAESVKRVLNEGKTYYHWDISTTNDEMEALSQVDTSYDEYGDFYGFKTPDAAFRAGLKQLRSEWNEGKYMLEVWGEEEWEGGQRPQPQYINGYIAVSDNGKITKY